MKTLREHLVQYLKLRRQLGYKLKEAEFLLRSFTTLAEEEGAEFITTKLALRWAARPHLKPGQSGSRLSTLRRFAAYVRAFDARTHRDNRRERCFGYMFEFSGHGIFELTFGRLDVSSEDAKTHNQLLSQGEIAGLDQNCDLS